MGGRGKIPTYAIRLALLGILIAVVFFGGLQLFVPEGSKLTGSYDAASLKYIAAAPVAYARSESCGSADCHKVIFTTWSQGAHGANENQSKCEVCHGPQGAHPEKQDANTIVKVRGYASVTDLCLSCHRQLKARLATGQPQIEPKKHPYPNEGTLVCTQCHNPHAPGMKKKLENTAVTQDSTSKGDSAGGAQPGDSPPQDSIANSCFSCHGQSGRGGFAPQLAGQSFTVLKDKLTKIKSGEIDSPMMKPILMGVKEKDIDELAKYFAEVK